jgi:hypothetical protein
VTKGKMMEYASDASAKRLKFHYSYNSYYISDKMSRMSSGTQGGLPSKLFLFFFSYFYIEYIAF